jgi:diaminopimelate epimerase
MTLTFTKMHGLGNDFVMLEWEKCIQKGLPVTNPEWLSAFAKAVCDRHLGIGADGLILAAPPSNSSTFDVKFVYLNSDGSIAEMCGNGIRCFALYALDKGYVSSNQFTVETLAGPIKPTVNNDRTVTVDMGPPVLEPDKVPFVATTSQVLEMPVLDYTLNVMEHHVPVSMVSMGNPHCLVFQNELATQLDPAVYGPALEKHPAFPAKTNVEFIEKLDETTLKLTVWERGCGFTLACGTGACATAVGALLKGVVQHSPVTIHLPGGPLSIRWDKGVNDSVWMTGPATYVAEGTLFADEWLNVNNLTLGSSSVNTTPLQTCR